ncbi:T9SS type B sorting domain-containing protein [Aestuariivivens sediminis]|uniref:T9SS type B sorting domain-containing protein n=1 Tax=Aestuariivivens sediminis TaxID=2913557 RepID=UPI0023EAF02B|nr:T9SS type B sorting domain-containing protein [Aestuariivivens sediminis]
MKHYFYISVLCIQLCFSQKEANIWYFGSQAGLDFNSGNPVVLTDGQNNPNNFFGTASIADSNGNLLFYCDGPTVWNKNHQVMQNGTNLDDIADYLSLVNPLIVPKPGNSNIYYLFTSGDDDGLRYSEIDMSLDGGLGAVTSSKRISVLPFTGGSISATFHSNGKDIWVVTHGGPYFYSVLVTDNGVNMVPTISQPITNLSSLGRGSIKLAPNGKKLIANVVDFNEATLLEFNNTNGTLNNPINLISNQFIYSGEFSSSSNFIYIATEETIFQFNLNTADIIGSKHQLTNTQKTHFLQLGPDNKIYCSAVDYWDSLDIDLYLSVINDPNKSGLASNYIGNSIYLNGKKAGHFPQFIQSYFNIGIQTENVCLGEPTQFLFNSSHTYDSFFWDFGDGTTSSEDTPQHTYISPGDYTVTLTVTSGLQTASDSKTITIFETPVTYRPQDLVGCDDDNDGISVFDLTSQSSTILNGQDTTLFEVSYYATIEDYNANITIANPVNYSNTTSFGVETIIASVKNRNNYQCENSTSFTIQVFELPNPSQNISTYSLCDNTSFGSDTDGLIMMDLTQKETEILNGVTALNFEFSYFTDAAMKNQIVDPTNYQNTNSSETIHIMVSNKNNAVCSGTTSFKLVVHNLPTVTHSVELKQCDDDLDGFSAFNLSEANAEISANYMNEFITFYEDQADTDSGINAINNISMYINQVVSIDVVYARVENSNGCFRTAKVILIVSTTQIPIDFVRKFYACDHAEDGVSSFDFSSVNSDIESLFPSGQDLAINYYQNLSNALAETDPIADISDYRNIDYPYMQQIYVRVDSKVDNDCIGLGAHINLYVEPLPEFTIESPQIVCSSDPTFTLVLDPIESNFLEFFNYEWVYEDGTILSNAPTLTVSTPGTYSVNLTRTVGTNCSRTKEVVVNASELAKITSDNVTIVDVSNNNTVTINTSNLGLGNYEFTLDNEFSSYQDEPVFENVSSGIHTLFVRDKKGCGTSSIDISIIGFPKFFTPNGDGNNDTWQIKGVNGQFQTGSDIFIYDRYGKLLKQLTTTSNGWDGTFKGTLLSSDDYWFSVYLQDGREFKGHFTLKR